MTAVTEQFKNPGDIIWDAFYIVNANNQRADILGLCPEVHIFEDMFANSMTGWATVVDTHGMIDTLPIMGQEELYVQFHTPGMAQYSMNKKFRIVSVTDRVVTGNKQVYTIHFVSYDAYADMTMQEQRAFTGTADNIIPDILTNLWEQSNNLSLTENTVELKKGTMIPTNRMRFVSPSWSPFKCINYVAAQALSSEFNVADYFFFESSSGYQFKSLTEMFKSDFVDSFKYDADTAIEGGKFNPTTLMRKIHNLTFSTDTNQVQRLLNDGYGVKTVTHDILTKHLYTETPYFPEDLVTNKIPLLNGNDLLFLNNKEGKYKKNLNVKVANSHSWAHDMIPSDNNGPVTNTRKMMLTRMGFTELDIEVWGRSWLEAGQVVWVDFGNYAERTNETEDAVSKRMTGKYLVTAVHHMLAPAQHKMSLQIVKESVTEPSRVYG